MKTPESYEKDEIKKFLKSIGAYFISPSTFGMGASGTPDIVACIDGRFWAIEVKREGKQPTPIQNARMDAIRSAGGIAVWGTAEKVFNGIYGRAHALGFHRLAAQAIEARNAISASNQARDQRDQAKRKRLSKPKR